jgi:hypothetical protein
MPVDFELTEGIGLVAGVEDLVAALGGSSTQ